jgi:molybdopterin-guanine dinucleotide biosynthesis protein A
MGMAKADLLFFGQPLLARVIATMRLAASPVHVVLGVDQRLRLPLPSSTSVVRDAMADQGPLAGLIAGLRACETDLALVVGCDMPFLDAVLLRWLATQAADVDAVIPVVDERPQYLHALFRVSATGVIERSFAEGVRSLEAAVDEIRTRFVTPPANSARSFTNINTADDLRRAESAADAPTPID